MVRAVFMNGQVRPLDPIPADWTDGTQLKIDANGQSEAVPEGDIWAELAAWAQGNDPEDEKRLAEGIAEVRRRAKELAKQGKR